MGGTSNSAKDTKLFDACTGGSSATLKAAMIGAFAAILAGSIAAAGALAVSNQQIDSQQQSTQKDRLRVACTDFLKASDAAIEAVERYRVAVQDATDAHTKAGALDRVEQSRGALTAALYPLTLAASSETGRKALGIQVIITESQNYASKAVIFGVLDGDSDGVIESIGFSSRSLDTARRFHAELLGRCQAETGI
jgi:hypothetical protein